MLSGENNKEKVDLALRFNYDIKCARELELINKM